MRKLSWKACLCCMKNHLTSLGRSLGRSIHFTKRKFYEHHLDCFSCFSFWNGHGVAHGWVSELIGLYHKLCCSLLVLELHAQTRPKIGWIVKNRCQPASKQSSKVNHRTWSTLMKSPKMRAFRQTLSESLVCFLSAEALIINFKRVNLKSKSLLPWVVGRRSLPVMQQIGRHTPPRGKSLS